MRNKNIFFEQLRLQNCAMDRDIEALSSKTDSLIVSDLEDSDEIFPEEEKKQEEPKIIHPPLKLCGQTLIFSSGKTNV